MPTTRPNPHLHPPWLGEPDPPFVPIMDALAARPDPELNTRSGNAKRGREASASGGWGGKRPGAGAPKGNLNALKHGRTSRRQRDLLEALLEMPETRQALIDIADRNRKRRKQAEEGAGLLLVALLEKLNATLVNQEDNQAQINQELLEVINTATAQIKLILEKRSRRRHTSIKRPPTLR